MRVRLVGRSRLWPHTLTRCRVAGGDIALNVEITAKRTALLVGDTIAVTCVAHGPELLEDHWKYPGKVVRKWKDSQRGRVVVHVLHPMSFVARQANRGVKTVQENKKDHEILYTLTIPQASTKDSGIYSCSITDVSNNESQTKELAIRVFGTKASFLSVCSFTSRGDYSLLLVVFVPTAGEFMSVKPLFRQHESAELDEVREFKAEISSFPTARVTWLKDGTALSDVSAEISTSLQQVSETR